jgi:hypothetical protein
LLGMEQFDSFINRLKILIKNVNKASHESLILTKINTTTVEVRQAYQTKMFLTNLIFKSSITTISFMALFMINRFENFKYFKQLKHALEMQMTLSSVT